MCRYIYLFFHTYDVDTRMSGKQLIYTDRDCCSVSDQPSKAACLFEERQQLQVSKYNFNLFNTR